MYFDISIQYFHKSLEHFKEDFNDLRTPIHFATLYWYHKKFADAEQVLKDYQIIYSSKNLLDNFLDLLGKEDNKNTAFILSILLRLLVDQDLLSIDVLRQIKILNIKNTHPFELIYKWLGIAYLKIRKNDQKAISYFKKATETQEGLTIQTINLSTDALKIITRQKLNHDIQEDLENFETVLNELTAKSQGFKIYIEEIGGHQSLLQDIEEQNLDKISRWMPFNYA